jgi:predicted dehydrogenase
MTPLRFGLVGTGYWADVTHATALTSTEGVTLTSVWGRNYAAAERLAAKHDAIAVRDISDLLTGVDAVALAVPPDVQAPIATRAAQAGKHLLVEKPVALTDADADALAAAVERAGVASVVFFTARFVPQVRTWLGDVTAQTGWLGGEARWLGRALTEASPYNTPWRREKGGLWDVGPHVVGLLWASLGPVTSVTAAGGTADIAHLVLRHASGVTSTATVTLSAPPAAAGFELSVWGEPGRLSLPASAVQPVAALRTALAELAANARSGQTAHPCDVRFGRDIGRVLTAAQRQLDRSRET